MRSKRITRVAFALTLLPIACSGRYAAFETQINLPGYVLGFSVDPLVQGERNEATVTLTRSGEPINDAHVTVGMRMPAMPMPDAVATLGSLGNGRYAGPVRFSMSGLWQATIHVQTPRHPEIRTDVRLAVRDQ